MDSSHRSPPLPASLEPSIARMGDRVIATFLDGAVLMPFFGGIVALSAYWNHIPPTEDGSIKLTGGPALLSLFMFTIIWCLYYFVMEWVTGKTLGKDAMGIEVRANDGPRCNMSQAFLRNLLRPIDAFGFYLLGFLVAAASPRHQRIGDRVAETVVIENPTPKRLRAILNWLAAFALLTFAAIVSIHLLPRN
jgi:uncharacterized RDD family membrane protein YckC